MTRSPVSAQLTKCYDLYLKQKNKTDHTIALYKIKGEQLLCAMPQINQITFDGRLLLAHYVSVNGSFASRK